MSKSLIIFNTDGSIISIVGGSMLNEQPTTWIEIPEGKTVLSVDPSTNTPTFGDLPKTETQLLQEKLI